MEIWSDGHRSTGRLLRSVAYWKIKRLHVWYDEYKKLSELCTKFGNTGFYSHMIFLQIFILFLYRNTCICLIFQ